MFNFHSLDKRYILLTIPVLRYVFPWLQYRCSMALAAFFVVLWWSMMVLSGERPLIRPRALLKWGIIILIILFLYHCLPNIYQLFGYGMARQTVITKAKQIVSDYLAFLVVYVSISYGKFKEFKLMTVGLMCGVFITGINALRLSGRMMAIGSGRAMVTMNQVEAGLTDMTLELEDTLEATSSGLVNYAGAYICACMISLLVYSFFRVRLKRMKIFIILTIIACAFSIRSSGLATPSAVAVFGVIIALLSHKVNKLNISYLVTFLFALSIVCFAYNPKMFSFMASPIRGLAQVADAPQFQMRLHALADAISGVDAESYAYERYGRQRDSITAFLEKPILGNVDHRKDYFAYHGGGHSELLDKLAYHGLVGGILYFLLLFAFSRCMYFASRYLYNSNCAYRLSKVLIGTIIIASIANPIYLISGVWYILTIGICMFYEEIRPRNADLQMSLYNSNCYNKPNGSRIFFGG